MYFDRLEKNLIDIIKEEQAKLGFRKEAIRLYYPLSSLNHFFEAEDSEAEMLARLSGFPASLTKKLGNVTVTAKKDRFCFHIPEDGSVYVHEHTDANEFIRSLVELLQHHGCTMDDIFSLFKDTSENVIFEEMNHGEFDWLVYFEDGKPDAYCYCIADEGCHLTYHRFTKEDYEAFGFETT